jgi:hypothetical protein
LPRSRRAGLTRASPRCADPWAQARTSPPAPRPRTSLRSRAGATRARRGRVRLASARRELPPARSRARAASAARSWCSRAARRWGAFGPAPRLFPSPALRRTRAPARHAARRPASRPSQNPKITDGLQGEAAHSTPSSTTRMPTPRTSSTTGRGSARGSAAAGRQCSPTFASSPFLCTPLPLSQFQPGPPWQVVMEGSQLGPQLLHAALAPEKSSSAAPRDGVRAAHPR